jgi:curved DNA-binding protein
MSNPRDYYEVLGVSRQASADEIKAAYRKLARTLHPDVNKAPDAAERFGELQRAYEALSDPEKRKLYDQFGHAGVDPRVAGGAQSGWPGGAGPGGGTYTWTNVGGGRGGVPFDDVDLGSIFEDMFGGAARGAGGRPGAGFGSRARARSRSARGHDLAREIEVGFEEAVRGGTRSIRVSRGGSSQTIDVKIPPGTADGAKLRVRGAGRPSAGGGGAGDLILTVKVAPHPVFSREGDDLVVELPITIAEAALGAKVRIPTLGKPATLTVPPGTSSGQRLRLKGQGVPKKSGGAGDLHARVKIVGPKKLSKDDQDALRRLGEKLTSPRTGPHWPG